LLKRRLKGGIWEWPKSIFKIAKLLYSVIHPLQAHPLFGFPFAIFLAAHRHLFLICFSLKKIPNAGLEKSVPPVLIRSPRRRGIFSRIICNFFFVPKFSRVARFILMQHTKTGKNVPNDHKIYIPNGRKTYLISTK
jgi:hypothetical protein